MINCECEKCTTPTRRGAKYCIKCGAFLLDQPRFIEKSRKNLNTEKRVIMNDVMCVLEETHDRNHVKAIENIESLILRIFEKMSVKPYLHEDIQMLIDETLTRTLRNLSFVNESKLAGVEYKTTETELNKWLQTYQEVLEELLQSLFDEESTDAVVDITTLKYYVAVQGFLKSDFDI